MDRALFISSFPLLCPRTPSRLTLDSNSRAGFSIEHFECHSACFALQFSDSFGGPDWPKTSGRILKESRSLSAVASLIGFLHTLNAVETITPVLSRKSERKDYACHSSAEQGPSLSEASATSQLKEDLNIPGIKGTNGAVDDNGKNGSPLQCSEKGPFVGNPIPSDQRIGDDGASDEQVKNQTSSLATSTEGSSTPVKEPIYEVQEVNLGGTVVTKSVSRRLLLKTSGLRLRDIRSVDPSLWVTNAAPALLVRDQAILLNLGSLRAIASADNVLIFDYKSVGAVAFLELLLQRLNPDLNPVVPTMPFELEVVEAALLSRTQRLERRLMEIEPRVLSLLEVLPNCLTANILEELRLTKQALVELGSKAGALRQMLLELLDSPQEIRRMTIMGRGCTISKEDGCVECTASVDKQLADDEEEELEMLLENYLQRCESCHGQAERLLDSAKETEDSIAVNLSSRRLEVSRLELLLQVATFCSALGALVAGMFGMNLRSYLEGSAVAFWLTTAGIVLGGIVVFLVMYNYLKQRKVL